MDIWQERTFALHVHSRYSDGTGTVEEILDSASAAGLDAVVLTDHDTLAARREGWQGVHDNVALLVATEVTPRRQGHLLAMNVKHCFGYALQPNRATLDRIQAQGGYAIIAHPRGERKLSLGIHHVPWRDWDHAAVRGLEIWSYTHDWVDGIEWWRLPAAYEFWKFPERRVRGPSPEVLAVWDRLGGTRRMAGWAGLDCHARRVPLTNVKIFEYERMFGLLRNHIFVRPEAWKSDAVGALAEGLEMGRGFVAHDGIADASGTRCGGLTPDAKPLSLGEEAAFQNDTVLSLSLPRAAEIRWIANGRCRLRATASRLFATPAGPGVYRFEAWLEGRPWVFTNAFYLR